MSEETEEGQLALETQVEHALGVVKTQSGALSTAHDAHSHLSTCDSLEPDFLELLRVEFEIFMGGDVGDGAEILPRHFFSCVSFYVDMFVELARLFVVYVFELLKEGLLLCLISDGFVVVDEVFLSVLFESIEDLVFHLK